MLGFIMKTISFPRKRESMRNISRGKWYQLFAKGCPPSLSRREFAQVFWFEGVEWRDFACDDFCGGDFRDLARGNARAISGHEQVGAVNRAVQLRAEFWRVGAHERDSVARRQLDSEILEVP